MVIHLVPFLVFFYGGVFFFVSACLICSLVVIGLREGKFLLIVVLACGGLILCWKEWFFLLM